MSGMEFNKLFAAILVAGILAMLSGFIAKKVIHVADPETNAFSIEVAEAADGAGKTVEAVAEPILALLASADVAKGQSLSKVCAACHTFNKGEPSRVGPNLYGIVGAKHAHMEGFAYSEAMKALHDKSWGYSELNTFLWNPKKHIPGTKMVFAGMKKPEDRAALIAYLRSLADSPAPLPTEAEIAAEAVTKEVENADVAQEPQQAVEDDKEPAAKEDAAKEGDAPKADDKPAVSEEKKKD